MSCDAVWLTAFETRSLYSLSICFHGANDRFDCDCNLLILVFINIFWCTLFVAYFKYLLFYFFIITFLHACSSENIFSLECIDLILILMHNGYLMFKCS